jgi:two-component system cell cycle response regulator DivK
MENKSILLVEDNQMNIQLVRAILADQGYDLRVAGDADAALDILASFSPDLVLMDILLPGKSGLDLAHQLRANSAMTGTKIVALTAYARKGDEESYLDAGCDGYIVKPIDTATFAATVRSLLEKTSRPAPKAKGDVRDLLRDLRNQFIAEALTELAALQSVGVTLDKSRLLLALHRWAGVAGTLGMPAVTERAREAEEAVEAAEKVDIPAVQETLSELKRLVTAAAAGPAFELGLPDEIVKSLSGKRFGLANFSEPEARRISQALNRAECFTVCINTPPDGLSKAMVERFDLLILNLNGTVDKHKVDAGIETPILLVGSRASLSEDLVSAETPNRDFLMTPWDSEELLVRCYRLFSGNSKSSALPERVGPAKVIIADDDPAIGALLTAVLHRNGPECRLARNGTEALAMAREILPDVLILDVNMPGIDGFEVLTNLRSDKATAQIPVVLLTARQQESDVMKGFACGASDYITKPFNPMEVTARVARYLPRKTTLAPGLAL